MYAVMMTGGKQRRVKLNSHVQIERISAEVNETVTFDDVLLIYDGEKAHLGQPFVAKASVEAVVVDQAKGPKIRIIKMRRRKHSMTRTGHRQQYTWVKIVAIKHNGKSLVAEHQDIQSSASVTKAESAKKAKVAESAAAKPKKVATKKAPASAAKKAASGDAKKAATKTADKKPAAKKATAKTSDKKPAAKKATAKKTTEK